MPRPDFVRLCLDLIFADLYLVEDSLAFFSDGVDPELKVGEDRSRFGQIDSDDEDSICQSFWSKRNLDQVDQ